MVGDQRYLIYTDVGEGEWGAHDLIMERQQISVGGHTNHGLARFTAGNVEGDSRS